LTGPDRPRTCSSKAAICSRAQERRCLSAGGEVDTRFQPCQREGVAAVQRQIHQGPPADDAAPRRGRQIQHRLFAGDADAGLYIARLQRNVDLLPRLHFKSDAVPHRPLEAAELDRDVVNAGCQCLYRVVPRGVGLRGNSHSGFNVGGRNLGSGHRCAGRVSDKAGE